MRIFWDRRRFVGALAKIPVALVAMMALPHHRVVAAESAGAQNLVAHQAATLQRICFLLFPYPELGLAPYDRIVAVISHTASSQADTKMLLDSGIDGLDNAQSEAWIELGEDKQIGALKEIEVEPFFQFVLQTTKTQLFNDPEVWAHIGFEGSPLEHGGYQNHGLNDIDWLGDG